MLGAEAFYNEYIAPVLTEFISRRFEGICRDYFSLQVRAGKRRGVRNIGSYYYDDPVHRKNGEFDVVLEYADGYEIYEAKYYAQPMTLDEIHREVRQVEAIRELKVKQLGFIAINGFAEEESRKLLAPLITENVSSIVKNGCAKALTGPVERADVQTVKNHLAALQGSDEEAVYRSISKKLTALAKCRNPQRDYTALERIMDEKYSTDL